MTTADRSLEIAVLGLGQAGGNIAAEFHRRGYRALAFNTAKPELASLPLPDAQRIHTGIEGGGPGTDVEHGRECLTAHAERIRAAAAERAAGADVVVVAAGLGEGIGSCAPDLVAAQESEDALERFYSVNAMARADPAFFRVELRGAARDADRHVSDLARRALEKITRAG